MSTGSNKFLNTSSWNPDEFKSLQPLEISDYIVNETLSGLPDGGITAFGTGWGHSTHARDEVPRAQKNGTRAGSEGCDRSAI
jgi:hypothetical protein